MTDPVHMDFEEPDFEPRSADRKKKPKKPKKAEKRVVIPQLPPPVVPQIDGTRRGISNRDRAAVNLKLEGASYLEISDMLEFDDPEDAQRVVERALALTHAPDEWDTLRLVAGARAEKLLSLSLAMASATHLIDPETNEPIPNKDRLAWHRQAGEDLMRHAIITGAKAPAKVEITPDDTVINELVSRLLKAGGHEDIVDAEVLDLEDLPEITDGL